MQVTDEVHCTLREFLILGRLGFLKLGISRNTVLERLGEPSSFYHDNHRTHFSKSHRWYYKSLELHWHMDTYTLKAFTISPLGTRGLPAPLNPSGFFPTTPITIEEFKIYLAMEGISYQITRKRRPLSLVSNKLFYVHIAPDVYVRFLTRKKQSQLVWMLCEEH